MKTKFIPIIIFLAIIVTTTTISSFGVSCPYWGDAETKPLIIAPGETKIVELNLQNMVGDTDLMVKGNVTQGTEIASIKGEIYEVKLNTSDMIVPLKIKIPKTTPQGTHIPIKVIFNTMATKDEGMVAIGIGSGAAFITIVEGEIIKTKIPWALIGIVIAIIVIIIVIIKILKKRKEQQEPVY